MQAIEQTTMDLDNPNNITPKEITKDVDTGVEFASFGYYDGIHLMRHNDWQQTTNMNDILKPGFFIVCCGDVMITVGSAQFSNIERRIF